LGSAGCSDVFPTESSNSDNDGEVSDLKIHDIQGKSHHSPLEGRRVLGLAGVVTLAADEGFYMQSLETDAEAATSEGIWVATDIKPSVIPGDLVQVDGEVVEFFPGGENGSGLSITQIELLRVELTNSDVSFPEAQLIGQGGRNPPTEIIEDDQFQKFDPENDGIDFFESLEGMLVSIPKAVVVAPTNSFGEIAVVVDEGFAGVRSITGGIVMQENDPNPERLILDDAFIPSPSIEIGTILTNILGIIDYSYGNYKLQPIQKYQYQPAKPDIEIAEPATSGQLRIASYNVDNLDALDSDKRFSFLANQIVHNLKSPDIIGLQEIQDNNGPYEDSIVDASLTWQKIMDAILAIGGPKYEYLDIDPIRNMDGGEEGGNIRVGFLYREDTGLLFERRGNQDVLSDVQISIASQGIQLEPNPGRIEPENEAFIDSRKPLVAEFQFNGETYILINVHLVAKLGDTPLFGGVQPPLEKSESRRVEQAETLHEFVQEILKKDKKANIIILGDCNDYPWSKSINALKGTLLTDLVNLLPTVEQFTYIFEGNSQAIDHMLVSNSISEKIVAFNIVHINTLLSYGKRLSDHDPQLLTIDSKR
jgi:predicted extracellular nuclease